MACSRGDGSVAGGGEVVAPLEVTHLGAMLTGDFHGSIGGARVDDDEFVGDVLHRGEALPQEALLVLDDHTDAQPGLPVGVRQRRPGNWVGRLALFKVGVKRAF